MKKNLYGPTTKKAADNTVPLPERHNANTEAEYSRSAPLNVASNVLPLERTRFRARTKKQKIVDLYENNFRDLVQIAALVGAKPSYVAQVLQKEGLIHGYFDLYTGTGISQNAYSPFFRNVLSFRTLEAAKRSVDQIDALYRHFEEIKDRAGQHHAMTLALIGQNRARWSGKTEEAAVFHNWLIQH